MTSLYKYLRNTMTTIMKKNYTNETLKENIEPKLSPEVRLEIPQIAISYVQKQLSTLDFTKATGLDGMSAKSLRISSEAIAAHLTKVINLSLKPRIFPDTFKKAKVTPCFKKGDKSDKSSRYYQKLLKDMWVVIWKSTLTNTASYMSDSLVSETIILVSPHSQL